ncbi:MAG: biotin carboxylase N-terminal domain-containing protein [Acidimicrobiales bacterium]
MSVTRVLVANRGEIARRVLRTVRRLGLTGIAVYVDADAEAPYVGDADLALRLTSTYLDGAALVAAAQHAGADAVHPGYGFLSESAAFARQVIAAGLTWIGPPPEAIEAMGDKVRAKELAHQLGVPVLPWSDDPDHADDVGYPLLVKAAAGGGGKGMRVVERAEDLAAALAVAQREATAAFGDGHVFLERHLPAPRHVEVQILVDHHGTVRILGERECSIQRRHQKLIEETPSPAVGPEVRQALAAAAERLASAIGYRSAGTIEFLLDPASGEFYFLEVNTRLQVEHPITEEVTGYDLVAAQLAIAAERDVAEPAVVPGGWAIEARLCAEDPTAGFLPATGRLEAFTPAARPPVRWESGVEVGSPVSVAFDSLLAKVIAHAPTREEATTALARALERLHLGGVVTNRDFLVNALRSAAFAAGDTTTDFIERHDPPRALIVSDEEVARAAVAAALWRAEHHRREAPVLGDLPSGWRNARLPDQRVEFSAGGATLAVTYRYQRDGSVRTSAGPARVHAWRPDGIDLEVAGVRAAVPITVVGPRYHVQVPRGTMTLVEIPLFATDDGSALIRAGSLDAPMPGVVHEVRVEVGSRVEAGEILVVLEAMKMEHPVTAPYAGVVTEVAVRPGDQVATGTVLLDLEPEATDDEA